jgi:tetratricopeptide (TPR) repeat protein
MAEGLQLLRSDQAQQAKQKFDIAVKAAPGSADALTWRGICENQLAQFTSAAADFRQALRHDPSMIPAHYNLALSLIRLQQIIPAMEQLRIVIAAQPRSVQPRYNLAVLLEGKQSFGAAIDELTIAHTADPTDKGVTLHLLLDKLKLKQSALSPLVQDIADPSTSPEIQREAGAALIETGAFADAALILKSSHDAHPDIKEITSLLARAYIGDLRNSEAIALLASVSVEQKDEEDTYLLGLANAGEGHLQQAAENFGAAAQLNPKDARPLYRLALLTTTSPEGLAKSVALLRSAKELDPSQTVYALQLARVLLVSDEAEKAREILTQLQPDDHNAALIHALTGVALAATHQIGKAIAQLKDATTEAPNLAFAHNVLGFCLFQQGKYAEAAGSYARASELEPKRLLYARDAALAYERADQPAKALLLAEKANTLSDAGAADHLLLGKLYAGAGRTQDAIPELRHAAEMNPNLDAACYLLARTYMQLGDRQQALEWSDKLNRLKQQHAADINLQKKISIVTVRSSSLLEGGTLDPETAVGP